MKTAHIKTELPGPKARELLARDALVVSPSYPRDYPFVMSHGKGAEIWDVDGNRFLDFAAGIAVCSTGHSHPAVVRAIKDAADRFLHISSDYWHEGQVRLAERMRELAPMKEPVMSFFAQSGTESVEAALKLARYVTGRGRFLGFLGGFHGRTMGSLSFTSSKYTQQKGFFPTMPGVTHRFTNLHEFNNEVSEARIAAGFHWRFSTVVGKDMGWKIGAYTAQTCMQPLKLASK